jgi:molybdopterin molybdotransferase
MILFEQALEIVSKEAIAMTSGRVKLPQALGRVLAEDIYSDTDMPPFNKSAVDGFACRVADLGKNLVIRETIPAGAAPKQDVEPGTCSKIMTGAMVPKGADCVIMVEETEEHIAGTIRYTGEKKPANICYRSEDMKAGEKVLDAGIVLRPQEIAVLASTGNTSPLVADRPMVAVITTGDELVRPSVKPAGAMIRNSNSSQLASQVSMSGAVGSDLGIVPDNHQAIREILLDAMSGNDIVLLTGGVSMGDYDYVPGIMKSVGIGIIFRTIAIQPGKPTVFGTKGSKLVFGLPGNPVSSFVLFEMLVKPVILKMMGCSAPPITYRMKLGEDLFRRRSERKSFMPVMIRNGEIFPIEYHGSAHINAYSRANGIITMEIGTDLLKKGTFADVRPV